MKDSMITLGYMDLAIAVVQQAVEDYRIEYRKYLRKHKKSDALIELEEFFDSDYGREITFGMAQSILSEVRADVEFQNKSYFGVDRQLEYNGKIQTLLQWSKELGIPPITLRKRLYRGWSIEKALSTPMCERHEVDDEAI